VDTLIELMRKSGVQMEIADDNTDGARTLTITGKSRLDGVENEIMIDRNAVVTYAVAAIATKSTDGIEIKGAKREHIQSFLDLLVEMNGGYQILPDGIKFFYKGPLKALKRTVVTCPEGTKLPVNQIGIMTDWQALVSILFLIAEGTTTLVEQVFPNRFHHLHEAKALGAEIEFFDPATDPAYDVHYYFPSPKEETPHAVKITGVPYLPDLSGIDLNGDNVRLGAFGILWGLIGQNPSWVRDLRQLGRGYHRLIETLQSLGGNMVVYRKNDPDVAHDIAGGDLYTKPLADSH